MKIRIRHQDQFRPDEYESHDLAKGVSAIVGSLQETGAKEVQAVEFDETFDYQTAFAWLDQWGWRLGDVQFSEVNLEPDEFVRLCFADSGMVERTADLFRADAYPDRGLVFTEDDLDQMLKSPLPLPVCVEHQFTRFRLGEVVRIWREGKWLKGTVSLYKEADALLGRLGMRGLSVAFYEATKRLFEVSVVESPRVPGAQMFNNDKAGDGYGPAQPVPVAEGERGMPNTDQDKAGEEMKRKFAEQDERISKLAADNDTLKAENEKLVQMFAASERKRSEAEADAELDRLCAEGRVAPGAREQAKRLLMSEGRVAFSDAAGVQAEASVSDAFRQFLATQPKAFSASIKGKAAGAGEPDPERVQFWRDKGLTEKAAIRAAKIEKEEADA